MSFSLLSSPPPPPVFSFSTTANHPTNHQNQHPFTLIPLRKLSISRSSSFSPIPDEWGDKLESELESSLTRFTKPDPPIADDEWNPVSPLKDLGKDVVDNINNIGEVGAVSSLQETGKDVIDNINNFGKVGPVSTIEGLGKDVINDIGEVGPVSTIEGMGKNVIDDIGEVGPVSTTVGLGKEVIDGVGDELEKIRRIEKNMELKRCLIDSVFGSDLGLNASSEVRAEVAELVSQLEAGNPTPNPTEVPLLLQGKWVLVYTAFSELLPLLAIGNTSFLKIQQISQSIDIGNGIVENSTTLSTPFANFSFSASASFEVRSPSRIQVRFKEATFNPPQIKSGLDIPESVDVLGQKIPLPPAQQVLNPILNPVQEAAGNVSGALFGLPPLKIPIPGERTESWLLVTYLDADFRISRGDGGLFVLVREGSPLLL